MHVTRIPYHDRDVRYVICANAMKAILDRFEGSSAVLRIAGQELVVPRAELPKDAQEGAVLFLLVSQSASEEEAREKLAKSILNEILNNEV